MKIAKKFFYSLNPEFNVRFTSRWPLSVMAWAFHLVDSSIFSSLLAELVDTFTISSDEMFIIKIFVQLGPSDSVNFTNILDDVEGVAQSETQVNSSQ